MLSESHAVGIHKIKAAAAWVYRANDVGDVGVTICELTHIGPVDEFLKCLIHASVAHTFAMCWVLWLLC